LYYERTKALVKASAFFILSEGLVCNYLQGERNRRRLLPSRFAANPQSSFHSLRGTPAACHLPPGGRLFVSSIITQIGRENKFSADIYMCIRRGDLRSPAGEHSSPLPCSENILMRTLLRSAFFILSEGLVCNYLQGERTRR